MKRSLLCLISLLSIGTVNAQLTSYTSPYKRIEFGLNGGYSTTTIPKQTAYQGDESEWNKTFNARVYYNFTENWQGGLEVGFTKWETTENRTFTDILGTQIGPEKITYLFGDPVINVTAHANRVIPYYGRLRDFNYANFYYGISAGVIFTLNDGSTSLQNPTADSSFTFVSSYHYQSGTGYSIGLQLGYSIYITSHLGFNIEVNPKFCQVFMVDPRYGRMNDQFTLLQLPVTVGFRYRIKN